MKKQKISVFKRKQKKQKVPVLENVCKLYAIQNLFE